MEMESREEEMILTARLWAEASYCRWDEIEGIEMGDLRVLLSEEIRNSQYKVGEEYWILIG
jgi:hypothetical protein